VLFDCLRVPILEAGGDAYATVFESLEELLATRGHEIAAVVLEPLVQGAAGMRIYPEGYLRRARRACTEHDVLLVVDEVFTGYGRVGPMWACERAGVSPDILCAAKGFSGGMLPMAATLVTERVFRAFGGPPERAFFHGHSYGGNPLGAAVAREVLAVLREEDVLARARPKAARIAEAFATMASSPGVAAARSIGMIGALDLDAGRGYLGPAGWRVYDEARKRGAYLRPLGDVVYIAPPLTIPDATLDRLLEVVSESVRAAV
jgi:adenosylmethionine-8-amino-7-oxononanoate aminotransferase